MHSDKSIILAEYIDAAKFMWKRTEQKFQKNLGLVKYIDFSDNKLKGTMPTEISFLAGLVSLNLSRNYLVGSITPRIGQLISIEVLDLSNNNLSGDIPASLSSLSSLGILDLSNNHLSGKIPTGTLLQGFDASVYMGNPELCGPPLQECSSDQIAVNIGTQDNVTPRDDNDTADMVRGLYISVLLGFIIGFWGICGSLMLKRSWRYTYFRYFDDMKDKLYDVVLVNIAKA